VEPRLRHGARRREQQIGQADRRAEQREDLAHRVRARRGLPLRARRDRQQHETRGEQYRVQDRLLARCEVAHEQVRVEIAAEQTALEEDQAGRPRRRQAAVPTG
jgi:hypothetical protein